MASSVRHLLAAARPRTLLELRRLAPGYRMRLLAPLAASAAAWPLRRPMVRRTEAAVAAWRAGGRDPEILFVVGFWRSATTLLHELLACDPANATPTLAEVLFPDDALNGRRAKRRRVERRLPETRGFDAVALGWTKPQEEEWALAQLGGPSVFLAFYLPELRTELLEEALFFKGLRPDAEALWKARTESFVATVAARHPERRLVFKNPANSTRIPQLAAIWPQARFLRIDRPKAPTIASFRRMVAMATRLMALGRVPRDLTRTEAESLYERVMAKLDADWAALPAWRRAGTTYEALTTRPAETLQALYTALELPFTSDAEAAIRAYWEAEAAARTPTRR